MSESRPFVETIQTTSKHIFYGLELKAVKPEDAINLNQLSKTHPTLIKRGNEYSIYACNKEGQWNVVPINQLDKTEKELLDKVDFTRKSLLDDELKKSPLLSVISKYHTRTKKDVLIEALTTQRAFDSAKYDGPLKEERKKQLDAISTLIRKNHFPPANESKRKELINKFHNVYNTYANEIKNEILAAVQDENIKKIIIEKRRAYTKIPEEKMDDEEVFNLAIQEAGRNYFFNLIKTELNKVVALDKTTETFLNDLSMYCDSDDPIKSFDDLYQERLVGKCSNLLTAAIYMNMVNEDYFQEAVNNETTLSKNNETARTVLQNVLNNTNVKGEVKNLKDIIELNRTTLRELRDLPPLIKKQESINAKIEKLEKEKEKVNKEYIEKIENWQPTLETQKKLWKIQKEMDPLKELKETNDKKIDKVTKGRTIEEKKANCKIEIQDAKHKLKLLDDPKLMQKFKNIVEGKKEVKSNKMSSFKKYFLSKFIDSSSRPDHKFTSFWKPKGESLRTNSPGITQEKPVTDQTTSTPHTRTPSNRPGK